MISRSTRSKQILVSSTTDAEDDSGPHQKHKGRRRSGKEGDRNHSFSIIRVRITVEEAR